MHRAVLLAIAIAVVASSAFAQLPPRGSIGLYADPARVYTAYCAPSPQTKVALIEMWAWCQPGENGLAGAEFAVSYPTNAISDRTVYSGDLSLVSGSLAGGLSVYFTSCRWDWCWVAHQAVFVNTVAPTALEVVAHPAIGAFQFYSCAEGNPAEPCLKGAVLSLNAPGSPCLPPETAIGTERSTWGSVKSLFGI